IVEAKLTGHHANCYCLLHNQGDFWLILLNFCLVKVISFHHDYPLQIVQMSPAWINLR
ncbi:Os07g0465100, partial [Oryza sativa Japonica Group]